jgi:hypothetical protein
MLIGRAFLVLSACVIILLVLTVIGKEYHDSRLAAGNTMSTTSRYVMVLGLATLRRASGRRVWRNKTHEAHYHVNSDHEACIKYATN